MSARSAGPDSARMVVKIVVMGAPQGKGRARAFAAAGGKIGHYTPDKTRTYEGRVSALAMEAMQGLPPIRGPVRLDIEAYFEPPKDWRPWKRAAALDGSIVPTIKPDIDNIVKAISDGLNGICWVDDAQVVAGEPIKLYGETACVRVRIEALPLAGAQITRRSDLP